MDYYCAEHKVPVKQSKFRDDEYWHKDPGMERAHTLKKDEVVTSIQQTNSGWIDSDKAPSGTDYEEPMKKKDWNFKEFTGGLRALTVEYRKSDLDMTPEQVWETTHIKEWMKALYGGYEGYEEWEKEFEARLTKLK